MPLSPADAAIRLVRAGSTEGLNALATGLEDGTVSLKSSPVGLSDVPGVSDTLASEAFKVFAMLRDTFDESAVALALRTAAGIRTQERLDRPQVEICWTGPDADDRLVSKNSAAIESMLHDCRDTGEILLVGYSFRVGEDTFMSKVIDLLCDASGRKAKIQIILHQSSEKDNKNKDELLKKWDVFARKPSLYTWNPPEDHPYTKLHAKCLVVDRLQALVTSANFTFHGLESNIELGLLVRNQPIATAIHERFDHLINAGVLVPWEDPK